MAVVFITGIGYCDSITPDANVSINGLYFSDTGCTICKSGLDATMLNPIIYMGMFEFRVYGEEHDRNKDVMQIKQSGLFNKPIDEITYYNISHTEIDGWPALVGVVERKVLAGNNTDARGFIYVDNLTIEFGIIRSFNLEELPELLGRIKITQADTKNMSWNYIDSIGASKIIPKEVSRNGLHVYLGRLSNPEGGGVRWSEKELVVSCCEPDLTMTVKYPGRPVNLDEDKARLTKLITRGISNSSITYFNITEMEVGGWPALVAVVNSEVRYISGSSEPPESRAMAFVYVGNLTVQIQSDRGNLRNVKLTIEPGAEQRWIQELSR
jgi:hypothetical protein